MTLRVLHLTHDPRTDKYSLWDSEEQALRACTEHGEDYRPRSLNEDSSILERPIDPPSREVVGMMMLGALFFLGRSRVTTQSTMTEVAWLNSHALDVANTAVVLAKALNAVTPEGSAA